MAYTYEMLEAKGLLAAGQYTEALHELEKTPAEERGGEWYFLRSQIETAMECHYNSLLSLKKAVELDPTNQEYKKALKTAKKKSKETSSKGAAAAGMVAGVGSACDSFRNKDFKGCCSSCCEGCGEGCCEGCCECFGEAACDNCDCDCDCS